VIVLVRQRGPLFDAILQALKRAGVPVAGADRLKLSEHIAVMDLMALGDALMLERDDLALASALKSPLFGFGEQDLFALAHGRTGSLSASLNTHAKDDARFAGAMRKLARWRDEALALRPFDFYSRVLGRDRGREQMMARLGHEAADALDEFLAQALAYEQTEAPSLAGFLNFLRRAGTEVKRDLEVESNSVRVMTVHGAKGLEAPLIVLADTTTLPDGRATRLHSVPGTEAFIWAGKKPLDSTREQETRQAVDKLREEEYRRLLYVALTRAADALIVCGFESANATPREDCWYRLVRDALAAGDSSLVPADVPYAEVLRWRAEQTGVVKAGPAAQEELPLLPSSLTQPSEAGSGRLTRIIPSQLDPDDESRSPYRRSAAHSLDPQRRGDLLHRLLQFLPDVPAAGRRDAATRWFATIASDLAIEARNLLIDEALRVIEHPELSALFGPGTVAEVDVLARGVADVTVGRIDRLCVTADSVFIVDFKTGAPPADAARAPINYVRQLAIYSDVLARIYPDRAMRGLLVWTAGTAGPAIHKFDEAALKSVLATAGQPNTGP
jgi:ATP-dependent helicase/nuclease subunit A